MVLNKSIKLKNSVRKMKNSSIWRSVKVSDIQTSLKALASASRYSYVGLLCDLASAEYRKSSSSSPSPFWTSSQSLSCRNESQTASGYELVVIIEMMIEMWEVTVNTSLSPSPCSWISIKASANIARIYCAYKAGKSFVPK